MVNVTCLNLQFTINLCAKIIFTKIMKNVISGADCTVTICPFFVTQVLAHTKDVVIYNWRCSECS